MIGFKRFIEETEEQEDIQKTLNKLPKSHAALVRDYKWRFQAGNILKGDNDHVGMINDKDGMVHVAAPWRYSREFTVLHEIGHRVYAVFVTPELKKEWAKVVKKNTKRLKQNNEENFCMAYAAAYCEHTPLTHHCLAWIDFVKNKIPK